MQHISLFSGIGGFEIASEWMGWENLASCEINPFGRKVLSHYWPHAYHHDDIKTLTYEKLNHELSKRFGTRWRTDDIVLTGGFPCQPYSTAGFRKGTEDERHLWPEMLRAIRDISPRWVVGENVRGLTNWNGGLVFNEVQAELESSGYEVLPFLLPAAGVGAPHRRDRIWFVAHTKCVRQSGQRQYEQPFHQKTSHFREASGLVDAFHKSSMPYLCRGHDGVPQRLDSQDAQDALTALGNAIVPQIALQIFRAIEQYEMMQRSL